SSPCAVDFRVTSCGKDPHVGERVCSTGGGWHASLAMTDIIGFCRVALLSLALSSPVYAQHIIGARDDKAVRVDSIFRAFDRTDSPGCALGVYQDGAVRYARGYGMASLEHGVPLSPRSVLDVGSISKQFT